VNGCGTETLALRTDRKPTEPADFGGRARLSIKPRDSDNLRFQSQQVATGSLNRFFKLEETPVNRWDLSWQLSLLVGEREAMSSGLR